MTITVLVSGALTTFQDLGRAGFGASGVPISGAFDTFALRAANSLAGNAEGAPALEFTMSGPTLRFDEDNVVVLTGSRFAAMIERDEVPNGRAFEVRAGQVLSIGWTMEGARGYLAICGLIAEERVLGSASRHVAAALGPPPIASGDVLVTVPREGPQLRELRAGAHPAYASEQILRVTKGAQWGSFAAHSHEFIFEQPFRVAMDANRSGVRLEGPSLDHAGIGEIDPEGITPGAVQVPPDGRAIVLGPDGPVTGGYPKICNVIAADLCLLGHSKPGDTVRFREVTMEEARAAWMQREEDLHDAIDRPER